MFKDMYNREVSGPFNQQLCITKNPYSNEYPDEIGKYTLAIPVQIEDIVTEN